MEEGYGLFLTFKDKEGFWTKLEYIDTGLSVSTLAILSSDGKYIFFSSRGDIYWVEAKIISNL